MNKSKDIFNNGEIYKKDQFKLLKKNMKIHIRWTKKYCFP